VQFVDGQVEQLDQGSILSRIRDFEPHLLAAAISLPSLEGDLQLLDSIKRAFPAVGIAATGTVVKVLHREVLLRSRGCSASPLAGAASRSARIRGSARCRHAVASG
jgi:hypothetical protein